MKDLIINKVKDFVLNNDQNWFNETNERFFDEPLIQSASSDNTLFVEYKKIIGEEHLTPQEAYERQFGAGTFSKGSVISVVLPINKKIRESNRNQKAWPSKEWVLHRTFGDSILIKKIGHYLEQLISSLGYCAVAPYLSNWFRTYMTPKGASSIWSERHIAYAAGLGTFSLNDAFITEKGICIRLISVVTNVILEPDEQKAKQYAENCLFHSKNTCGACIKRCPVNAITEKGHNKLICYQRTYGEESQNLAISYGGDPKAASGCGLCLTGVPCEYKNPHSLENL